MPIPAIEISDLQTTISANADVAAATALRHPQGHPMGSQPDHTDVSGEDAVYGDTWVFDGGDDLWHPRQIVVVADGGTR